MLDEILTALKKAPGYRNQIFHVEIIPPSRPEFTSLSLPPILQSYLKRQGITLYRHQGDVINAIRTGKDVIITTPTASGKTLSFNLPILEGLLNDPEGTALYLYPLKALANDQLQKLLDLEKATGLSLLPATYDGDTPTGRRAGIKSRARIILTNPHALHHYLPWHHQWDRLFHHLRYFVIDEAHHYRGVFGVNVALLFWRFFRILSHYGASPQIILSSASVANPTEYAAILTGRPVVSVADDTSARGAKHVLFWDTLADPDRSITAQAAQLLAFLTTAGIQTLCFTQSRAMAEVVAKRTRDLGVEKVVSYRAGYLPHERREIERGLRERQIDGVVSTSALEAGIDIGSLDAVILVGFPGSLLAAWQQAGRAGRGKEPSLVVYMPYENPLDQYLLRHPQHFLGKERERLVIRTNNPRLRAGHLACACAELPVQPEEVGPEDGELLEGLTRKDLLAKTTRGYIYRGLKRAHDLFGLDSLSGETIKLVCAGELLETMTPLRACRDAHPGAVLLHQGNTYVVESLNLKEAVAEIRQEDVDYYTKSLRSFAVEILETEKTFQAQFALRAMGRVRVTESFVGYKTLHFDRTISVDPLDLPPHTYDTDAVWLTLPLDTLHLPGEQLLGGLHGAEHALIAIAPLLVLCDREDIGGISTPLHPQTNHPTVLIFDEIENGAGLAEVFFAAFPRLAQGALKLVETCPCEEGCPSCLYSPRCGNHNQPLHKAGAIHILRLLAEENEKRNEKK